ncbi:MAG: murein L,D-transpeptidase [Proteobacteria bacterium]|nr:murein L,D-transpeptidase [Pseudomonadota bacterium]
MLLTSVRSLAGKSLRVCSLVLFAACCCAQTAGSSGPPTTPKVQQLMTKTRPGIQQELQDRGFALGQPVFVRIFKFAGILEVWMNKGKGKGFELFKSYRICNYSGFLGPKVNEGDWQAPEGFYSVSAEQMNPKSSYHLAFDIGYPNEFDTANNRTGRLIMVHGDCQSVGCFAMTNERIEEIYLLAHEALQQGQERFAVHIFPFPLTQANLKKFAASPWIKFWQALEPGYTAFEQSRQVPEISVHNGEYVTAGRGQKLAMQQTFEQGRSR